MTSNAQSLTLKTTSDDLLAEQPRCADERHKIMKRYANLPSIPDFARSAQCLDNRRLGKQRVEAKQVYLALTDPSYGWQHHPAVKMWRGCEHYLLLYGREICAAWTSRGFNDSLTNFFAAEYLNSLEDEWSNKQPPQWLGNPAFHLSHQSNLVRKDSTHYRRFFPDVPDNLPYIWPTSLLNNSSLSTTSGMR